MSDATWDKVRDFDFSTLSPPIDIMGEREYDETRKIDHFPRFHVIGEDGVLVCKCAVKPRRHEVWKVQDLEPKYRWTLCNASKKWLEAKLK